MNPNPIPLKLKNGDTVYVLQLKRIPGLNRRRFKTEFEAWNFVGQNIAVIESEIHGCLEKASCLVCGIGFYKKHRSSKYCSAKCKKSFSVQNRKRKPIPCAACGKLFYNERNRTVKTCSRTCGSRFHSEKRTMLKECGWCKVRFSANLSDTRKFCSKECAYKNRASLLGYNHRCQQCGAKFHRGHKTRTLCITCKASHPETIRRRENNRVANHIRARITHVLKGRQKAGRTMTLLGCSLEMLRAHIESKFKKGMTWQNHGAVWHIDHIQPCASFNLIDPEQQRRCFHFSNLQPLFVRDNLSKSDSIVTHQPELIISFCE